MRPLSRKKETRFFNLSRNNPSVAQEQRMAVLNGTLHVTADGVPANRPLRTERGSSVNLHAAHCGVPFEIVFTLVYLGPLQHYSSACGSVWMQNLVSDIKTGT
jgi:hypothetical protein